MFFNLEKKVLKLASKRGDGFYFQEIINLAGKSQERKLRVMKAITTSDYDLRTGLILNLAGSDPELGNAASEIFSNLEGDLNVRQTAARYRAILLEKHPNLIGRAITDLEEAKGDLAAYSIGYIALQLRGKEDRKMLRHAIGALARIGTDEALEQIGRIGGNIAIDALFANGTDNAIDELTKLAASSPSDHSKILEELLKIRTFKSALAIGLISKTDVEHDLALSNFISLKHEFNATAGNEERSPAIEGEIEILVEKIMHPVELADRLFYSDRKQANALRNLLNQAIEAAPELDGQKIGEIFEAAAASVTLRRRSASLERQADHKIRSTKPLYEQVFPRDLG